MRVTHHPDDWGARSSRWAGIRSELVELRGARVSLLRAEGAVGGPVQLLVHGLGGSASNWLDVMVGLSRRGPVIAPDLPGFGQTEPPHPRGTSIRASVSFLRALTSALGIEHAEVHGNSMGGLISVLLAERAPELVDRLVLVNPALPGPWSKLHRTAPQTLVAFAPFAVPWLGRWALHKVYGSRTAEQLFDENQHYIHGDPSRVSPALQDVGRENLAYAKANGWRLEGFATATESLVAALLSARSIHRAILAVEVPTLLLWGTADQLIGWPAIEAAIARRPDWRLQLLEGVGHAPMIEVPDDYLARVHAWLEAVDDTPGDAVASEA